MNLDKLIFSAATSTKEAIKALFTFPFYPHIPIRDALVLCGHFPLVMVTDFG